MTKLLITCVFGIFIFSQAYASLDQLQQVFSKKDVFHAPAFSETIRTVSPVAFLSRFQVDTVAFAQVVDQEKEGLFRDYDYDDYGAPYSDSALAARGWSIFSNGGYNSEYAINALLGLISKDYKQQVEKNLPEFATYYHLRAKNEQSEPYGFDLFVIADGLLEMENGRVLILKIQYSYY